LQTAALPLGYRAIYFFFKKLNADTLPQN